MKALSLKLKRQQTPWEQKLWRVLRNRGISNLKFRRQFSIGPYIVDFCCLNKRLIIELDGGQHNQQANQEQDSVRQKYLENQGYKVLRFWNTDIDQNLQGVVQIIIDNSQASP